eukprot:9491844-Pyramimonas_sp.AAC.1
MGGDWNFHESILELSGMPRKANMVILKPPVETCSTPAANSFIDYFAASPAVAKLVDKTITVTTWPHRPHKPVQLHFKAGVSGIKQLVYQTHQRLPRELPVGPSPQPPSWVVPRALAEEANRSASHESVSVAWELLNVAWKSFSDVMGLELE